MIENRIILYYFLRREEIEAKCSIMLVNVLVINLSFIEYNNHSINLLIGTAINQKQSNITLQNGSTPEYGS